MFSHILFDKNMSCTRLDRSSTVLLTSSTIPQYILVLYDFLFQITSEGNSASNPTINSPGTNQSVIIKKASIKITIENYSQVTFTLTTS